MRRIGKQLVRVQTEAQKSVTSTSFVTYDELSRNVKCSGGFVTIKAKLQVFLASTLQHQARLLVNGKVVDLAGAIGQSVQSVPLFWEGNVNSGDLSVLVQVKINSGTLNINKDGSTTGAYGKSTLSIVEIAGE